MKLYQINVKHIAPKDSRTAIYCYLVADNSEQVYEWIKKENRIEDEIDNLYTCFEDYEEDFEDYKETIVKNNGESGSEYERWDDLYYGRTHIDWVVKNEHFNVEQYNLTKELGFRISYVKE